MGLTSGRNNILISPLPALQHLYTNLVFVSVNYLYNRMGGDG